MTEAKVCRFFCVFFRRAHRRTETSAHPFPSAKIRARWITTSGQKSVRAWRQIAVVAFLLALVLTWLGWWVHDRIKQTLRQSLVRQLTTVLDADLASFSWERGEDLELGYDQYMHDCLNSKILFRRGSRWNFFPKIKSNPRRPLECR